MPDTFKPCDGDGPYIFISYARKDKDRVLPAAGALANAGYRVWYDEGIPWTKKWRTEIARRVQGCEVFVVFHSEASIRSKHCDAEIDFALSNDRNILSVYLERDVADKLDPGLKMYLHLSQAVKLYEYDGIAAFVERLGQEAVFAPCKAEPEWNRIGQIQWKWDPSSGLLTIAENEDLRRWRGSIPPYQEDPIHGGSTAPWMPYREQIRSVEIRDDIDAIGDLAFCGCAGLTSVTIPDSVTAIGDMAFAWCAGLTSVTIPDSVKSIGFMAFKDCAGLTSVTIGDSVTAIGDGAFSGCAGLIAINIDEANRTYSSREGVLFDWDGKTLIRYPPKKPDKTYMIPDSVVSIDDEAFLGCAGLTSVTIPDSVTSIGFMAFYGCAGLTSVTIPDSVASISHVAFAGCAGLIAINVDETNRTYSSREGVLCDWSGKILVQYPTGRVGKTYAIPDSVTAIGDFAFAGCAGLTSVRIGNRVTSIGDAAFQGCAGLTSVTIPNSVTSIDNGAFSGCAGLTSVTIPAEAELGFGAFPEHTQIVRRPPRPIGGLTEPPIVV